jgi:hypothetical protein
VSKSRLKTGWGKRPMAKDRDCSAFLTYVGCGEAEVDAKGTSAYSSVSRPDAGTIVSPDNIRNQFEGAPKPELAWRFSVRSRHQRRDRPCNQQLPARPHEPRPRKSSIVEQRPPAGVGGQAFSFTRRCTTQAAIRASTAALVKDEAGVEQLLGSLARQLALREIIHSLRAQDLRKGLKIRNILQRSQCLMLRAPLGRH